MSVRPYTSLKASDNRIRIRRILKESSGWCIFPAFFNIHKIFLFGDNYLNVLIQSCTNAFWKDVIVAFQSLYNNIWSAENAIHNTMPIWHNTRICAYFNKEWFYKGIKFVNDLFTDGSFVTLAYLQNTMGVKCNFLEYANIKSRIMKLRVKHKINNVQPILPYILKVIQLSGKGCRTIYTIIQNKSDNIILTLKEKWEQMLNDDISEDDIQNAFKITQKFPKCVCNRYVQFKILHDRLNTRQLLHKMNAYIVRNKLIPQCMHVLKQQISGDTLSYG